MFIFFFLILSDLHCFRRNCRREQWSRIFSFSPERDIVIYRKNAVHDRRNFEIETVPVCGIDNNFENFSFLQI